LFAWSAISGRGLVVYFLSYGAYQASKLKM
jgi:hypothetical protein